MLPRITWRCLSFIRLKDVCTFLNHDYHHCTTSSLSPHHHYTNHLRHSVVLCPQYIVHDNSLDTCTNKLEYNSSCSFECDHGYGFLGSTINEMKCVHTQSLDPIGEWDNDPPFCHRELPTPRCRGVQPNLHFVSYHLTTASVIRARSPMIRFQKRRRVRGKPPFIEGLQVLFFKLTQKS